MMTEPDAPDEAKAILREAFMLAGDRIAFARSQERVNGNVFSKIPVSLRYCSEGTGDALQPCLFGVVHVSAGMHDEIAKPEFFRALHFPDEGVHGASIELLIG